ncbi:MAG TPA: NAD(P)/FAD-dependent oxidoreductase [Actinomycetota bacterium]|nr:NAD(P)/FAD-dependent oxidoreductase [Actinomycetota bacterium]
MTVDNLAGTVRRLSSRRRFDAIVVGGGHNGLVAAFDLASAGLSTIVLERRPFVGGACVTEEFAPGFRASSGAYVLSMLRRSIWRDMRLVERGIRVDPAGPTLNVYPDAAHLWLDDDLDRTVEDVKRLSPADAAAFPRFERDLAAVGRAVTPVFERTPPSVAPRSVHEFLELAAYGRLALAHRKVLADAAFVFTASMTQFLDEYFSSPHVAAALGWHAVNDSVSGPSSPGTAYVLLHDHASEDAEGGVRQWGFVRGGIGRVTEAMADAVRERGGEIRTDAEVDAIVTNGDAVAGVRLASGEELQAPIVVSNADPKRTFLSLCADAPLPSEFVDRIQAYRCEGTSIKINLALSSLPAVAGQPAGTGPQPYHYGIMEVSPFLADLDRHQADARSGVAADPAHIEICFPTVHDPSLAPDGKHVATIDVNSQPYSLTDGGWDAVREDRADRAIAQLEAYFPGLSGMIEHRQVLTPLDLERQLGLTGGHALHGEMSAEQLFLLRPVRGWGRYRTPLRGLYLCGAGTHPGGGVTGANGRNAAREIVRDAGRSRRRASR